MKKTMNGIALALLMLLLCPASLSASDGETSSWYAGAQGGIPMAMSTSSSFGGDKTRCGWSAGAFAGRRFSDILSIELQLRLGSLSMSPRDCCDMRDYWLGNDGCHYFAPVLDMDCLRYDAVMSKVSTFRYGLHLNVSMLPLICSAPTRWSVTLSPGMTTFGSKATIHAIADDSKFVSRQQEWNVGLSCDLHVGYAVTPLVTLGIYTGLTFVSGDGIDGMPRYLHTANTVWDSGIRLTYNLRKGDKR